jgi:hypothetical protein
MDKVHKLELKEKEDEEKKKKKEKKEKVRVSNWKVEHGKVVADVEPILAITTPSGFARGETQESCLVM